MKSCVSQLYLRVSFPLKNTKLYFQPPSHDNFYDEISSKASPTKEHDLWQY